jgi:UDP-N-acetylmuramoyl-tripeptide--D-alanyl-D-alanine ligase
MLTATAETIASVCRGEIVAGRPEVVGNDVVIDSRLAAPGCVFVAMPGEHVDGHDFLHAVLSEGARVLIVTWDESRLGATLAAAEAAGAAVVHVADSLLALQDLAAWHRRRLLATVVGITGSNGKTTTKDFLRAVLEGSMRVVATEGNKNNEVGLPLTLLRAGTDTDVVVVEMGMRGLRQIARLAEIARPTVGLVTNVGVSHIEVLGSTDAVATAKGELVLAIPADGIVLLNGDDSYTPRLSELAVAPVVTYGLSEKCDVRATGVKLDGESRATFTLKTSEGEERVSLPTPGRHNVYNALAAAACAIKLGIGAADVASGLSSAVITDMRMQVMTTADGVVVINDAYNANPTSMKAAIETLAEMRVAGNRVAVLGDMAELGSLSELAHFEVGEKAAQAGIDRLFTVGVRAERIADGARAAGLGADKVTSFRSLKKALPAILAGIGGTDVVLVKASRVMGLEAVVEGIVGTGAV